MPKRKLIPHVLAATCALGLFAGCSTTKTTPQAEQAGEVEVTQVLGSRIPVKKKKERKDGISTAEQANINTIQTHQNMRNDARFPTGGSE